MSWFESWNHESVEALHERDRWQINGHDIARRSPPVSPEIRRKAMADAISRLHDHMARRASARAMKEAAE